MSRNTALMNGRMNGTATNNNTSISSVNPQPPYGTVVPVSFEPKSSNGHLASFCYHCNQRVECHGSYWALGVGTLRVCDPVLLEKARATKASDQQFRNTLRQQEAENCRPTKTVANMERHDPLYYDDAQVNDYGEVSEARHHVTKVLQPILTPYGTSDNNYDAAQTEVRRGRRPVDGNLNNGSSFYGSGAIPTPEPQNINRSNRYR